MAGPNDKFNKQAALEAVGELAKQPENTRAHQMGVIQQMQDLVLGRPAEIEACDMISMSQSMAKLTKAHPEQAKNTVELQKAISGHVVGSPMKCGKPVME